MGRRGGWTHKSSNGSSIPGGHSRKGDHQKDDDGTDTAEEVLRWEGLGCRVKKKLEGKGIALRFSRLVDTWPSAPESLHGDAPGHYIKHLRENKREGAHTLFREGMQVNAEKSGR